MPAEQLAELEQLLITQAVSRVEVLMRQGDLADALYLVASGRFAVNVDGRRIAEVGSGSPIGEIGFFADGIRTATVTALRDSIVLKLRKEQFAGFAERHPAILKPMAVTLARRLADTLAGDEQSLTHPRTPRRDRCGRVYRAGLVSPGPCLGPLPLRSNQHRGCGNACRGTPRRREPRFRSRDRLVQQTGTPLSLRALFRRRRAYPRSVPRSFAKPISSSSSATRQRPHQSQARLSASPSTSIRSPPAGSR